MFLVFKGRIYCFVDLDENISRYFDVVALSALFRPTNNFYLFSHQHIKQRLVTTQEEKRAKQLNLTPLKYFENMLTCL